MELESYDVILERKDTGQIFIFDKKTTQIFYCIHKVLDELLYSSDIDAVLTIDISSDRL